MCEKLTKNRLKTTRPRPAALRPPPKRRGWKHNTLVCTRYDCKFVKRCSGFRGVPPPLSTYLYHRSATPRALKTIFLQYAYVRRTNEWSRNSIRSDTYIAEVPWTNRRRLTIYLCTSPHNKYRRSIYVYTKFNIRLGAINRRVYNVYMF